VRMPRPTSRPSTSVTTSVVDGVLRGVFILASFPVSASTHRTVYAPRM
jgi:hypothetical protein